MNKVFVTCLILSVTIILAALVFANNGYKLSQNVYNVETNIGTVTLHTNNWIGGTYTNSIFLRERITVDTDQGIIVFDEETEVDCDVPPGHPNPCDPY